MQTLQKAPVSAAERTRKSSLCGVHDLSRQGAVSCGRDGSAARGSRTRTRQGYEPSHRLQAPRIIEAKNQPCQSRILESEPRQGARAGEARCRCLPVEGRRVPSQHVNSTDARVRQMVESGSRSRRSVHQVWVERTIGSASYAGICARPARLQGQEPRRCAPTWVHNF